MGIGPRPTGLRLSRAIPASLLVLAITALAAATGCQVAKEPDTVSVVVLNGSAYDRGFQHGERLKWEIRSFYTKILTASLLPYLNREQADVAGFLTEYAKPEYENGQFSYQILLQSAHNLMGYIPQPYLDEMQGIADGAQMPLDEILILNTFADTMLSFRAITLYIKEFQAPILISAQFLGGLDTDWVDNDGDGQIDQLGEGAIEPYGPSPYAAMTEVPTDAKIQFALIDYHGVNPDSIRIRLNDTLYVAGDPSIEIAPTGDDGYGLRVVFTPPGGLPEASVVSVILQAGDLDFCVVPPLPRHRYMRDERIVFTTRGYGLPPQAIDNRSVDDGTSQPPSIAFAVRGSATPDGRPLLAHHFALLDAGASHDHTVLFTQVPDDGIPHSYVGWAGVIGGFSGMNARGVTYAANLSDTLDNPLTGKFNQDHFTAKLLETGVPIGVLGRELLARSETIGAAATYIQQQPRTFGWNILLADPSGSMGLVEVDANFLNTPDAGFFFVTPDPTQPGNLDRWGRPVASVGPDDLRTGSHFVRNTDDIERRILLLFHVQPQRYWSSFFFRSVRAVSILGEKIAARYGAIDVDSAIDLLREDDLIDRRDSMNAVVYDPWSLGIHYAMGKLPATDAEFRSFSLGDHVETEGGR
jgi:hypothetical protein